MIINVVHATPETASSFGSDHDGFVAAMGQVAQHHEVRWLNVHPAFSGHSRAAALIADADFVLVRSDWGWLPCATADKALFGKPHIPVGLLIAGSSPAPVPAEQQRFDVLFYETPWYAPFVAAHPNAKQAFGVDATWMRVTSDQPREWDWMMVGRLAAFKRPERLMLKKGRRLAVGDLASADPAVVAALKADGIVVQDYVPYAELAALYNNATAVLVPCTLQGGGERAVIEARSCGCHVEVAEDNPKLTSLLRGPIDDHVTYGNVLLSAIEEVVAGRRVHPTKKREGQRRARWSVWSDKAYRAPDTIRVRAAGAISSVKRTQDDR